MTFHGSSTKKNLSTNLLPNLPSGEPKKLSGWLLFTKTFLIMNEMQNTHCKSGYGMASMLDFCYANKLSTENSKLEVVDYNTGEWKIYY